MPPERAEKVVEYLAQRNKKFLVGSVYTTFMLLHGLYEHGEADHGVAALRMMTQCSNASWCNSECNTQAAQHACGVYE